MQLEVSSHVVARLVANLAKPKLSPVAEAAAKHESKVKSLLLKAVKKTRDAVPMRELESVLIFGGSGAPLYVLEDALKLLERELLGDGVEPAPTNWLKMRHSSECQKLLHNESLVGCLKVKWDNSFESSYADCCAGSIVQMRTAAANTRDLPSLLSNAIASGAGAVEMCITGNELTQDAHLASSKIAKVERLGFSRASVVTFEDGSKAVFKRTTAELSLNETAARLVAKELKALDIVPSMVERTVNGEKGILVSFVEGKSGARVPGTIDDSARGAVLDFILGNGDRNANNWIVRKDGGISLIDHDALFRPIARSGLLDHVRDLEDQIKFGEKTAPSWFNSPSKFGKSLDADRLIKDLRAVGVSEVNLSVVAERIKRVKQSGSWAELVKP